LHDKDPIVKCGRVMNRTNFHLQHFLGGILASISMETKLAVDLAIAERSAVFISYILGKGLFDSLSVARSIQGHELIEEIW